MRISVKTGAHIGPKPLVMPNLIVRRLPDLLAHKI
jgi:hypothetical protein